MTVAARAPLGYTRRGSLRLPTPRSPSAATALLSSGDTRRLIQVQRAGQLAAAVGQVGQLPRIAVHRVEIRRRGELVALAVEDAAAAWCDFYFTQIVVLRPFAQFRRFAHLQLHGPSTDEVCQADENHAEQNHAQLGPGRNRRNHRLRAPWPGFAA